MTKKEIEAKLKKEVPLFVLWLKQNKLYCKFLNDARKNRFIARKLSYEYNDHCPIYNFIANWASSDWNDLDEKWHNWIIKNKYEEI